MEIRTKKKILKKLTEIYINNLEGMSIEEGLERLLELIKAITSWY